MIPSTPARTISSSGVTASSSFGISRGDEAHIMGILRDQLYTDKVLAVLREYGSNAWDAHRAAGKKDLPIQVTLPTVMDPTLTIRDFGFGLTHQEVFEVYTQYGASTKRDSDDAVGMLGIGSKSGFAYSDSFTISTWNGGTHRTYVAVLDESEKGVINLLHTEVCADEETGVQIQIPVRPEDIQEFGLKAKTLFEYFVPRPEINIELPPVPSEQMALEHGSICSPLGEDGRHHHHYGSAPNAGKWVAVMGCVPYHINLDQLRGPNLPDGGVASYLSRVSGALYFNIGEVQVSASREELKYSTSTKAALIKKFAVLVEEFVRRTLAEVERGSFTSWEKRLRAQVLGHLGLPVPKDFKDITQTNISFASTPTTFTVTRSRVAIGSVVVASGTRFVIKDDYRDLDGYGLSDRDYVVRPIPGTPLDDVRKELADKIIEWGLQGITVVDISTLTWWEPRKRVNPTKKVNRKHQVRTFKLDKSRDNFHKPWSNAWTIEQREPTDDDVFVVISGFNAEGYNFFDLFQEDRKLAQMFGVKLPEIYGYKTTRDRPVRIQKVKGVHYPDWRRLFAKSLLSHKVRKMFDDAEWATVFDYDSKSTELLDEMTAKLGPHHPITAVVRRQHEGHMAAKNFTQEMREGLKELGLRLNKTSDKSGAFTALAAIYKKYPLLQLPRHDINQLWEANSTYWVEYVKTVDRAAQPPASAGGRVLKGRSHCTRLLRTPSPTSPSPSSGKGSLVRSRRAPPTTSR